MEKFQALTGIRYDSVFVFPHSIGTESILEELKTYNFLATVNSSNVPMDRSQPSAPLFALRPVTLSFAGLPKHQPLYGGNDESEWLSRDQRFPR